MLGQWFPIYALMGKTQVTQGLSKSNRLAALTLGFDSFDRWKPHWLINRGGLGLETPLLQQVSMIDGINQLAAPLFLPF
jgi:hypothetical protein